MLDKTHAEEERKKFEAKHGYSTCVVCAVMRPVANIKDGKCSDVACSPRLNEAAFIEQCRNIDPRPTPPVDVPNLGPRSPDDLTGRAAEPTEPHEAALSTLGVKADAGKSRVDLLPPLALIEVGHVLGFGAVKYAPDNWRKVRGWRWRYLGAALRHLLLAMSGEELDTGNGGSGLPHLAHAACCVLFVLELEKCEARGVGVPDGDAAE